MTFLNASTSFSHQSESDINSNAVQGKFVVPSDQSGLYSIIFAQCPVGKHTQARFSYTLSLSLLNVGPNYLSARDMPLPWLYFGFACAFAMALILWIRVMWMAKASSVSSVHIVMMTLLLFKVVSLIFESARYQSLAMHGIASGKWSVAYYVFSTLKGLTLFTAIMLVGSGYSLVRVYLSDVEKRVAVFVLVLQALDHVAMIVLDETAPGSQQWLAWRDVLHIVDIVCCCLILFPMRWFQTYLKQSSEAQGKASASAAELQRFKMFCTSV